MAVQARAIWNGVLQRFASLSLAAAVGLAGCTTSELPRLPRTQADLISVREADAEQAEALRREVVLRALPRTKAEYDAYAAGRAPAPPVMDFLILSGGGDWGAFGAGVLKGWGRVAGPMARPSFDVVTGVSTGALIAPFAFLGDDAAIDRVVDIYRHPREDLAKSRGFMFFLPNNPSFYVLPGLEEEVREKLDRPLLERIVAESAGGRNLIVNTTNIDLGEMRAWD